MSDNHELQQYKQWDHWREPSSPIIRRLVAIDNFARTDNYISYRKLVNSADENTQIFSCQESELPRCLD